MGNTTETWNCITCNVELADRNAVFAHLQQAHDEKSDSPRGVMKMVSPIDGGDFWISICRWTYENGATVFRSRMTKR